MKPARATESTPAKTAPLPAYVVRMRPALARAIAGLAYAKIPRPSLAELADDGSERPFPLVTGDRLFLVEVPRTGRADLVTVAGIYDDGTLLVYRGWGWSSNGKNDDDLTALGCAAMPTNCAVLEPVQETSASTLPASVALTGEALFTSPAAGEPKSRGPSGESEAA